MLELIWVLMCGINVVYDLWALTLQSHEQEIKKRKQRGLAAKQWLIDRLEYKEVEMQSHGTGKYGRVLGELFVEGVNINQLMVEKGHATEYDGGKR